MARRRDPLTQDLFEWQPPSVAIGYSAEVTGRGPLDHRISRAIGQALRDARDDGLSRPEVARRMADYLGRSVSPAMLDKWSSEASGEHRIPLDAFVALVHATGVKALLGFVPGEFGFAVIEDEYAELIEAQLIDDHIAEMQARAQVLAARRRARR